jgi:putative transposase
VYDLSELVKIHQQYRRTTSRFRRHDFRIKKELFRKYAEIAHDRRIAILHNVSSLIANRASALKQAIVMENLKGIRTTFGRATKSSAYYLSMLNAWPFAELQRQIEYKAKWAGLPVVYIDPAGTSNECSSCGGGLRESPAEFPMLTCVKCGLRMDRDFNAAKNIMLRALKSGVVGHADEAMEGGASRKNETAPKVDAGHSSHRDNGEAEGLEHC